MTYPVPEDRRGEPPVADRSADGASQSRARAAEESARWNDGRSRESSPSVGAGGYFVSVRVRARTVELTHRLSPLHAPHDPTSTSPYQSTFSRSAKFQRDSPRLYTHCHMSRDCCNADNSTLLNSTRFWGRSGRALPASSPALPTLPTEPSTRRCRRTALTLVDERIMYPLHPSLPLWPLPFCVSPPPLPHHSTDWVAESPSCSLGHWNGVRRHPRARRGEERVMLEKKITCHLRRGERPRETRECSPFWEPPIASVSSHFSFLVPARCLEEFLRFCEN